MMTRCSPAHFLGWVIRSGTFVDSEALELKALSQGVAEKAA
jgi:hypothetical protein